MARSARGTAAGARSRPVGSLEAVPSPTHVRLPHHASFSDQTGAKLERGERSVYSALKSGDLSLSKRPRSRRASMTDAGR
jgi:hypothetical protein